MSDDRVGVLFVCLGNICRSPLAEAVFLHHADQNGVLDRFAVDSCGMGHWHVGEKADPRARAAARRRGITVPSLARQFDPDEDPTRFHWLIAMDRSNVRALHESGAPRNRVHLMRSFHLDADASDLDVPDPYYGADDGFNEVLDILEPACAGLLDRLLRADR